MGDPHSKGDEGIIPRALEHIFSIILEHKEQGSAVASARISFLEIYNDECRDLLHQEVNSRDIMIREDKEGKIFFTGAREEAVSSVDEALYYLDVGNRERTTAETFMNSSSSRSHVSMLLSSQLNNEFNVLTFIFAGNLYHITRFAGIFGGCVFIY